MRLVHRGTPQAAVVLPVARPDFACRVSFHSKALYSSADDVGMFEHADTPRRSIALGMDRVSDFTLSLAMSQPKKRA